MDHAFFGQIGPQRGDEEAEEDAVHGERCRCLGVREANPVGDDFVGFNEIFRFQDGLLGGNRGSFICLGHVENSWVGWWLWRTWCALYTGPGAWTGTGHAPSGHLAMSLPSGVLAYLSRQRK